MVFFYKLIEKMDPSSWYILEINCDSSRGTIDLEGYIDELIHNKITLILYALNTPLAV